MNIKQNIEEKQITKFHDFVDVKNFNILQEIIYPYLKEIMHYQNFDEDCFNNDVELERIFYFDKEKIQYDDEDEIKNYKNYKIIKKRREKIFICNILYVFKIYNENNDFYNEWHIYVQFFNMLNDFNHTTIKCNWITQETDMRDIFHGVSVKYSTKLMNYLTGKIGKGYEYSLEKHSNVYDSEDYFKKQNQCDISKYLISLIDDKIHCFKFFKLISKYKNIQIKSLIGFLPNDIIGIIDKYV